MSETEFSNVHSSPELHLIVAGTSPRKGEPPISTNEHWLIVDQLDKALASHNIASVTTGAAYGVDQIATDWARYHNLIVHEFPANWPEHGKSAGPIRNRHMLRMTDARYGAANCVVIGFTRVPLEQSKGTKDCLEKAGKEFNFRTHLYRLDENRLEF